MDTIIQHTSTIATLYFTEVINTNNRSLDNAIITIITIFIVYFVRNIFEKWRQIYNCIIFHLYRMNNNPLEIWKAPYLYSYNLTSKEMKEFYRYSWYRVFGSMNLNKQIIDIENNLGRIINELIKNSGVHFLRDNDYSGTTFISKDNSATTFCTTPFMQSPGLYLIAFDFYGNPVYFSTEGLFYFKDLSTFGCIEHELNRFILEKLHEFKNNSCKNGIYAIKDKKPLKIGEISRKKTFDTLFYSQKKELVNLLHSFTPFLI